MSEPIDDDELDALESYWKDIHHPKYEGVYEGDALRLIAEIRRLRAQLAAMGVPGDGISTTPPGPRGHREGG